MLKITAIILAAGSSSRFGSDKLLFPINDQQLLCQSSAKSLLAIVPEVIAVIGSEHQERQQQFSKLGINSFICQSAEQGLGYSLAHGIRCSAASDGWVIALSDMPFIQPQTITQVYQTLLSGVNLCAPYYKSKRGHPVGFGKRFQTQLEQLTGDQGAKKIINNYQSEMTEIATNDEGILRDIDFPSDLKIS